MRETVEKESRATTAACRHPQRVGARRIETDQRLIVAFTG
jgi:hypothetical protein